MKIILFAVAAALLIATVAEARSFGSRSRLSIRTSRPSAVHYAAPAVAAGYLMGHSRPVHARPVSPSTTSATTAR